MACSYIVPCFPDDDDYVTTTLDDVMMYEIDKPPSLSYLLPTPPWSPCSSSSSSQTLSDDDGPWTSLLDAQLTGLLSAVASPDTTVDCAVLNDCMWSAGLLPPDLCAGTDTVATTSRVAGRLASGGGSADAAWEDDAGGRSLSAADIVCVNPSIVSPFPRRGPSVTSAPREAARTSCARQSDDDDVTTSRRPSTTGSELDDDDSGEEVDVVSVSPQQQQQPQHHQHLSSSTVRDLLVLPSNASVLAQVTAMHNYSSCHGPYQSSRVSCSAPQSPLSDERLSSSGSESDRPHPASTPVSPCPSPRRVRHHYQHRKAGRRAGSDVDSRHHDVAVRHGGGGGKRALHNVLERRRRDHLKWSFEALRNVVPATAGDVRMPKVAILRRARDHVRHLHVTSQRLQAEHDRLRSLQQRWQYKLALLMRCTG